jgi:hypothetical protein
MPFMTMRQLLDEAAAGDYEPLSLEDMKARYAAGVRAAA